MIVVTVTSKEKSEASDTRYGNDTLYSQVFDDTDFKLAALVTWLNAPKVQGSQIGAQGGKDGNR